MRERGIGPPSEKGEQGLGRRVEEEACEKAGDECGGPRSTARGMCDRELKEESSWTGTAARHAQAFVTETTTSMMQAAPPTSLRARMSSIDWPEMRAASWAPLP